MNFRLLCICEQQSLEQEDIGRPILQVLRRLYDKIPVMEMELEKIFQEDTVYVTVHIGLRTCCADRRLNWASEQKSHRRRRFSWIFACCCERVNSNQFMDCQEYLWAATITE